MAPPSNPFRFPPLKSFNDTLKLVVLFCKDFRIVKPQINLADVADDSRVMPVYQATYLHECHFTLRAQDVAQYSSCVGLMPLVTGCRELLCRDAVVAAHDVSCYLYAQLHVSSVILAVQLV